MILNSSLIGWVPYKLLDSKDVTLCEWLFTGEIEFKESFFDETINKCRRLSQNVNPGKNITDVLVIPEWTKSLDFVEPAAFIFHVSRCGSTMLSQLLTSSDKYIVLSEVPFFDDVLRIPYRRKGSTNYNEALLKDVVKFYSQKRNGNEDKAFIKTDSWHIVFHERIRKMFPEVPFILLYRTPDEVIRSLNKRPGMHCVPQMLDPEILGIKEKVITSNDFYNYPVKVIEKYMETYIDVIENDSHSFLLNYKEGMIPIMKKITEITGTTFTEDEWEIMKERLLFHSKYPGMYFSETPVQEKNEEKFLRAFELYDRLEQLRINRP